MQRQPSLADQIACLKRELNLRREVYPRLVRAGKMAPADAEHETAALAAALATIKAELDRQSGQMALF